MGAAIENPSLSHSIENLVVLELDVPFMDLGWL